MSKISKVDLSSVKTALEKTSTHKGSLGLNLLEEAVFMKKTLKKLKSNIRKNGVITKMCQGDYDIERANPALSQYNSLIKNYNSTIKQITDLLSDDYYSPISDPEDEFDEFNK